MSGQAHVPYFLAGVCTVGGVIGYAKARSAMSLIGGAAIGAMYAGAGYMIEKNEAEKGHMLGLAASLLLAGAMGRRYGRTGVVMPAGALAGVGFTGAVYHGLKFKEWKGW